jgi:hypothetical protein
MSDATIQAALQTLIRGLDRYTDANVTLGDFRRLVGARCVIMPGALRDRRAGDWAQTERTWGHYLHLWRQFSGDDVSDIVADRDAVIERLDAYPTLDGESGVTVEGVESSEPQWLFPEGSGMNAKPTHVGFRIAVTTVEDYSVAGEGEFT